MAFENDVTSAYIRGSFVIFEGHRRHIVQTLLPMDYMTDAIRKGSFEHLYSTHRCGRRKAHNFIKVPYFTVSFYKTAKRDIALEACGVKMCRSRPAAASIPLKISPSNYFNLLKYFTKCETKHWFFLTHYVRKKCRSRQLTLWLGMKDAFYKCPKAPLRKTLVIYQNIGQYFTVI